jgi:hypothetical protein
VVDEDLAELVRYELTSAGLAPADPQDRRGGFVVEISEGVWVSWKTGADLLDARMAVAVRGAHRGEEDWHPALTHTGVVLDAMNLAIDAILTAAGFEVRHDAHEYRPLEMLVVSHRRAPHWRDPIEPPLDGASGYSPGVRVRILAGELAGAELTIDHSTDPTDPGRPLQYGFRVGDRVLTVPADAVEFAGYPDSPGPGFR